MLRRFLLLVVLLLAGLVLVGTLTRAPRTPVPAIALPDSEVSPTPTATATAAAANLAPETTAARRAVATPAPASTGGLDALARLGIRRQLRADAGRHYLDSMMALSDSVIRRWPTGGGTIRFALVPGGPDGWTPRMADLARSALAAWDPASVGLTLEESPDTTSAAVVIRWIDQFPTNRTGETNLTWDQAGLVHRATVRLAVRDSAGVELSDESMRIVALHEMGHVLGLPHSAQPADLMFPSAGVLSPSQRDRFSLRLLYDLPTGSIRDRP